MSKSKKKSKSSNEQKRSNKFNANKLHTNQSRSEFRTENKEGEVDNQLNSAPQTIQPVVNAPKPATPEVVEAQTEAKPEVETEAKLTTDAQPTKDEKSTDKDAKSAEKEKQKKKDAKAKKGKRKFGQRTKETFAELKRVTWPSFGETMKKTGLVIAVVLFFGVALFAIERLLSWLYTLLTSGILD